MEGFPQLPGYNFTNPINSNAIISRQFEFVNGHPIPKRSAMGKGGQPLDSDKMLYLRPIDSLRFDPSLTYGRSKSYVPPIFKPHFVLYDKKCLTFKAFFKQGVSGSPLEYYRVRKVNIIYFLEDDTMTVMEPPVPNAGFPQGRLVTRGKLSKDTSGTPWNWKDLNVGMEIGINGIVYHVSSCDSYTREYLISQGIDVNPDEEIPSDPYEIKRKSYELIYERVTPKNDDKLRRFLEYNGRVLRFYAWWDDRDSEFGTMSSYIIYYFLSDDTIEICEDSREKKNRGEFQKLLRRMKVPKNSKLLPVNFPNIYLEQSDEEIVEYYQPSDFLVGRTMFILGRRFLIYDCDEFTRKYYSSCLNIEQGEAMSLKKEVSKSTKLLPPYLGLGSIEDSIQSWYHFNPKPPKTDIVRYLHNMGKKLRYTAVMDFIHPEDQIREFIFEYSLSDGTIKINEVRKRNSGFIGGIFLKPTLVPKPETNLNNPEYYTPADLEIGSVIDVFGHQFKISGVDLAVYRYMEANPEKFRVETIDNIQKFLVRNGYLKKDVEQLANLNEEEVVTQDENQVTDPLPKDFNESILNQNQIIEESDYNMENAGKPVECC